MICRMDFDIFFGILIFYPKWGFCMGYSLWMMADFQNGLLSRIFGVFWSGFFAQNKYKWFVECILTCFLKILIFDPKWGFCMGFSLCMMGNFENALISRIFVVFWSVFFAQNKCKWFVECILTCFLEFQFLTQSEDLHWLWPLHDCRLSKWSRFWNIWCFLERFLAQNNSKWFVELILICFLEF